MLTYYVHKYTLTIPADVPHFMLSNHTNFTVLIDKLDYIEANQHELNTQKFENLVDQKRIKNMDSANC